MRSSSQPQCRHAHPPPPRPPGRTALHWCTVTNATGHKAAQTLIKAFKAKGINLSPPDVDHMTPLHWASFHNNAKCCELLLKSGAKVRSCHAYLCVVSYCVNCRARHSQNRIAPHNAAVPRDAG